MEKLLTVIQRPFAQDTQANIQTDCGQGENYWNTDGSRNKHRIPMELAFRDIWICSLNANQKVISL